MNTAITAILTNPLVAFVRKNLVAFVAICGAILLALSEKQFGLLGQLAYAPVLIIGLVIGRRIIGHLSGWSTIGAYKDGLVTKIKAVDTETGQIVEREVKDMTTEFHALPPATKCWMVIVSAGFDTVACAIILQHLWK